MHLSSTSTAPEHWRSASSWRIIHYPTEACIDSFFWYTYGILLRWRLCTLAAIVAHCSLFSVPRLRLRHLLVPGHLQCSAILTAVFLESTYSCVVIATVATIDMLLCLCAIQALLVSMRPAVSGYCVFLVFPVCSSPLFLVQVPRFCRTPGPLKHYTRRVTLRLLFLPLHPSSDKSPSGCSIVALLADYVPCSSRGIDRFDPPVCMSSTSPASGSTPYYAGAEALATPTGSLYAFSDWGSRPVSKSPSRSPWCLGSWGQRG